MKASTRYSPAAHPMKPVTTRFGYMIDRAMMGPELPTPGRRWQRFASNATHPENTRGCREVWISKVYLVQVVHTPITHQDLLMIRRIDGREITERWDELQRIKDEVAGPTVAAVEWYPPADMVVNLAPMRHLWLTTAVPPWNHSTKE